MRLLTWNILHGGGQRVPEIVLALLDHDADVVALSEYRPSRGGSIRGVLAHHGYAHQLCTDPPARTNGLLLASRLPLGLIPHPEPPKGLTHRFIAGRLGPPDSPTNLLIVHIPEVRRSTKKPAAWRFLLDRARELRDHPTVVLGDLNTGRHRLDEQGQTFTCTALLGQLETMGYVDAWRLLHPENKEFTWFSHEGGGFRIDHAHVSEPLLPRLLAARYSHTEREGGLSDHSALAVDLIEPVIPTSGGGGAGNHCK